MTDIKEVNIPEILSASISKYYSEIDTTWDYGTQLTTLDRNPYSRTYNVLSFPNVDSTLDIIQLGTYLEEYEGTFYYQVSNYFLESIYSSFVVGNPNQDFLRWKKTTSRIRQEIVYAHKNIGNVEWSRPLLSQPNVLPVIYSPLTNPYTLPIIDVGKALGAVVTCQYPIEIRLKNTVNEEGTLVDPTFILLTSRYLEIRLIDVTDTSHTSVRVDFFGEYKWRSFVPMNTESEENLIHPSNTLLSNRLKPPGLPNLLDNFWNSNTTFNIISDFNNRTNSPVWI
ncbi:hypothetical protein H6G33_09440 [Calothrix sp. FACHB-1219]|uniref:hypothetical protein n=1 Tax=unclassified Calothrix TaxID=2619626 RepID=UPI0016882579|nr:MULTISPECIES: hypothetical protein [unclassified Calothrix]MBD2201569.1 hypothetical protein [Calothrix sp. FACHB-168]MBD2217255.1 hypothetical protein [Calothrix sp. FACHB-1219]